MGSKSRKKKSKEKERNKERSASAQDSQLKPHERSASREGVSARDLTLKVELTLKGPVITGSTAAGAFGTDLPFARDSRDRLYIPGTLIKGRLREAFVKLQGFLGVGPQEIRDWFGDEPEHTYTYEPKRGTLVFSDFLTAGIPKDGVRTRIKMDEERGAVAKGAFLVIEAPFSSEEEVQFSGEIRSVGNDSRIPSLVAKALRWIPAFGGQKNVGFGRNFKVGIEEIRVPENETPIFDVQADTADLSGDVLCLELYPQGPFCTSRPRISDNLFESDTIFSGATIKGCMATTLNQYLGRPLESPINGKLPAPWAELGKHFSRIRCLHAFPWKREMNGDGELPRPRQYPLSLVRANGRTYDVSLCPEPVLIGGQAPAFSIDWKGEDFCAVDADYDWCGFLPTMLRVRTAISSAKGRAEEGKLFAYEMIVPAEHVWLGRMELAGIEDESERMKVCSQLGVLFGHGLKYFGKTKVDLEVRIQPEASRNFTYSVPVPILNDLYVVTLQTPALMLNPWNGNLQFNRALTDPSILKSGYQAFWDEASQDALHLERFLAQQRLLGGRYLHGRFQAGKPYNPFLMTSERSVFVLKTREGAKPEKVRNILARWLSCGLPLPGWVHQAYPDSDGSDSASWRTCPWVPENGFGEVAINMECHLHDRP